MDRKNDTLNKPLYRTIFTLKHLSNTEKGDYSRKIQTHDTLSAKYVQYFDDFENMHVLLLLLVQGKRQVEDLPTNLVVELSNRNITYRNFT